jgi:hypothetical protein
MWAIVDIYRPIGPAIILDILHHLSAHDGSNSETALTSAVISLVLPQMEGLRESDQKDLLNDLESGMKIEDGSGDIYQPDLSLDMDYLRRKAEDMFGIDTDEGE